MIGLRNITIGFAAGAVGGLAWYAGIWILIQVGLIPGQMAGTLLAKSLLYKQMIWGGVWGILLAVPVLDRMWWLKGFIIGCVATAAAVFYFAAGAAWPAQRIAIAVLLNGVFWGFGAGFWYWLATSGNRR